MRILNKEENKKEKNENYLIGWSDIDSLVCGEKAKFLVVWGWLTRQTASLV